jgi:hypothetical protein
VYKAQGVHSTAAWTIYKTATSKLLECHLESIVALQRAVALSVQPSVVDIAWSEHADRRVARRFAAENTSFAKLLLQLPSLGFESLILINQGMYGFRQVASVASACV